MKNFLKRYSLFLIVLVGGVVFSGCKTQKVRGEYSGVKKVYHNTTMRYNGYFNATVLLDESKLRLAQQYADNYNKVLPMYPAVAADNPKAVAESLDQAIEKVSVAVNLHRGADWTDDCYLLLGQAQYYKQDYEAAEETFKFMEVEFSPDPKKRGSLSKKSRERQAKSKAEKEQYKKERLKELKEDRKDREDARKDKAKEREQIAKEKAEAKKEAKKDRDKARKQYEKEMKAYKKAVSKARKTGTRPPTRPTRPTTGSKVKEEAKPTTPAPIKEVKEEGVVNVGTTPEKEAKPKKEAKKKVNSNDAENYFLKHRPVYNDGLLWLVRTSIERGNWSRASGVLSKLEESKKLSKEVADQLPEVRAHYHLSQKQYEEAIPYLEQTIEIEKDRAKAARYTYIIAQIKAEQGNTSAALADFEKVLKYRPSYEMEFSTRLNVLKSKYKSSMASAESTKKTLERYLKEAKNDEFQDQIYYSLAQLEFSENNTKEGIAYLEQSLSVPSSNKANQAEAFYALAKVYLEKEDYVSAKSYFDSTLGVLSKSDERYSEVERYSKNLADIAKNLEVVTLQDSLLTLSKLSKEELRARAFEIKKAENEKRLAAILAKNQTGSNILSGNNFKPRAGAKASSFFAYDDRAVKKGLREFENTWGTRPLIDNWRTNSEEVIEENTQEELEELAETVITDEDVKKIFKGVPETPQEKEEAQKKVEEAMFNLGRLYRDRLDYNKKAISTLEELLQKYPQTEFEPNALYYLLLCYEDEGDRANAKRVRDKLMQDYADTTFGRYAKNPSYAQQELSNEAKLNKYYNETYSTFKQGNYKLVKTKLDGVSSQFGAKNALSARFALLRAMTTGNLKGKEAYIESLNDVIAKYPDTPEQTRAREILRLLGVKAAGVVNAGGNGASDKYTYEEDKMHYMILVFENADVSLNDLKVVVSNYHNKYHSQDKLRISNIYLGGQKDKVPMIVVRRFKDKVKAMDYYDGVQKNGGDYVKDIKYELYPITQNNYREVLKSKSIEGYKDFFEANYMD